MNEELEELLNGYISIIIGKTYVAMSSDEKEDIKEKYIKILTKKIKEIYEPSISFA